MGTPMLLIEIITIERIIAAAVWSIIVYAGLPCLARVIGYGDTRRPEITMALFTLIGIGILTFQWRAFAGKIPVIADYWVAIALGSFCLSGIGVLASRIAHAPEEHQRHIILAHTIALVCLAVAGVIAA